MTTDEAVDETLSAVRKLPHAELAIPGGPPHAIQDDNDCEWKSCLAFVSSQVPEPVFEVIRSQCFEQMIAITKAVPTDFLPGENDSEKLLWKVHAQEALSDRRDAGMEKARLVRGKVK